MTKSRNSAGNHRNKAEFCVGFHAIESVLNNQPDKIIELVYDNKKSSHRLKQLLGLAREQGVTMRVVDRQTLDDICGSSQHQGVIAQIESVILRESTDLETIIATSSDNSVVLMLDQVQDPHNLGACLRTAECAGVHAVILPKDSSSPINQTVRKVASGAVENMDVLYVPNLVHAMKKLQESGYWVYGTSDQAESTLYDCKFAGKVVIVMGAEGSGIRRLTEENCDFFVKIPLKGEVSSLNVSVATGVILFEIGRQRS
jgi:23S rRNA (guanosine2251-2'-O)-methyltransferase